MDCPLSSPPDRPGGWPSWICPLSGPILMVVTLHAAAAPLLSDPALMGTPAWYLPAAGPLQPHRRPSFLMLSGFLPCGPRTLSGGSPSTPPHPPPGGPPGPVEPDLCPGGCMECPPPLFSLWSIWRPAGPGLLLPHLVSSIRCWGLYLLAPFLKTDRGPRQRAEVLLPHRDHPAAHHSAPLLRGSPSPGPSHPLPCWRGPRIPCWLVGWEPASLPLPLRLPWIHLGGVLGWVWDGANPGPPLSSRGPPPPARLPPGATHSCAAAPARLAWAQA